MSEEAKQPNRRRRWLRFRLRTFLIVLTIFCVWLGWYVYLAEQQRKAVKWVRESGGTVYYDFEVDSDDYFIDESQPPVPKGLIDMLGVDYFSTVTYVFVSDPQVRDVTPLATLRSLRWLYILDSDVSDVTPLAGLSNLEALFLFNRQANDVTPLAGLPNFRRLWLNMRISDVTPLVGLTKLEHLVLEDTRVSDEEIKKLQLALPNCEINH